MLLPDNILPQNCIYLNSSYVLSVLQKLDTQNMLSLYQTIKEEHDITFSIFVLCLDWLFLIDAVKLNSDGDVVLCS